MRRNDVYRSYCYPATFTNEAFVDVVFSWRPQVDALQEEKPLFWGVGSDDDTPILKVVLLQNKS